MTYKDWQKMSKSERELYYKAYLKGYNAAIKKATCGNR